jgi:hypothetical protein
MGCAVVGAWAGAMGRPYVGAGAGAGGCVYVGDVMVPCAQAAEADKASKEALIKILFISHSFDLCESAPCGTHIYASHNTLITRIVPSVESRLRRIVTACGGCNTLSGNSDSLSFHS